MPNTGVIIKKYIELENAKAIIEKHMRNCRNKDDTLNHLHWEIEDLKRLVNN